MGTNINDMADSMGYAAGAVRGWDIAHSYWSSEEQKARPSGRYTLTPAKGQPIYFASDGTAVDEVGTYDLSAAEKAMMARTVKERAREKVAPYGTGYNDINPLRATPTREMERYPGELADLRLANREMHDNYLTLALQGSERSNKLKAENEALRSALDAARNEIAARNAQDYADSIANAELDQHYASYQKGGLYIGNYDRGYERAALGAFSS